MNKLDSAANEQKRSEKRRQVSTGEPFTEIEVYRQLLKRLTVEDVEIEKSVRMWRVSDIKGHFGYSKELEDAVVGFVRDFVQDVYSYATEPDDALDSNALALKRHYIELLGGETE